MSDDLTENERKVLGYLSRHDLGFCFATLASDLRIDRNEVRSACRTLTDKRLATYHQTLWDDDGGVAGSGYSATAAGRALAKEHDD